MRRPLGLHWRRGRSSPQRAIAQTADRKPPSRLPSSGSTTAFRRAKAPASQAPYKVTIPNTTVGLRHGAGAGRRVHDGIGRRKKDEQPQHKVRLDAFWMQAHEVTWDEYRLFMFASQGGEIAHKDEVVDAVSRPTRPYVEMSFGMGMDGFPAISMTQHAANKYAEWLSARTGEFYRLPTEAEWEYACRAGTTTDPAEPRRLRVVQRQQPGQVSEGGDARSPTRGDSTTCWAT